MAVLAGTFAGRFPRDVAIGEDRSQQLIARAFAALSERGARRMRVSLAVLLLAAAALDLWQQDTIPGLLLAGLLVSAVVAWRSGARDRLLLIVAIHLSAAIISWELRAAGATRYMFFIAVALTVVTSDAFLVWVGGVFGVILHGVAAIIAMPTLVGFVATGLFLAGGVVFTALAADWAAASRRRVVRNAHRRSILEDRESELLHELHKAYVTERRLVDMAASLREAQSVLERDVQARKALSVDLAAATTRAEASNRAKSAFLARMSHELRTPLNSVIGFSSLLLRTARPRLEPREFEFLERIKANGAHLLAVINDVLDLSRIEAGRMEIESAPCDLGALLQDCVSMLESQAKPGVQLHLVVPVEGHVIKTDGARLRQVMINLVGNALKFTNAGSVTVALRLSEHGVPERFEVVDTGIGIPLDQQQSIFEPFEQADNSPSRAHGGSGLGLAICRQLCDLMGMRLVLCSVQGEGSTFSVEFLRAVPSVLEPIADVARRQRAPASLPVPAGTAASQQTNA